MDDLLSEFLTETSESLSVLDMELVKLEQNPDPSILQNIFRLVHTIKGTCGFLGLPRLEHVAHSAENVLGKFRDGELEVTPDAVTLILRAIDRIKAILSHIESTETEPEGNDDDLTVNLDAMADGTYVPGSATQSEAPAEAPAADDDAPAFPVAAELLEEVNEALAAGKRAASEKDIFAEMMKERQAEAAAKGGAAPAAEAPAEPEPANVPAVAPTPPAVVNKPPAEGAANTGVGVGEAKESAVAAQTIRVNVELLENLMTLVSELVLTRNALLQMVRGRDDSEFTAPLQRLSHITSDLQEGVMKTRMQPIGNAWAKLPRIVRDLSVEMNKKIDLQMLGAETELDRQILELIKDPLTHMVRNSADHGLEPTEERRRLGKPEVGKIVLNAYHEGGHIIIEITDDGRGLNIEKIRQKVITNGLATEAELDAMSPQQIYQFIFRAGFSTAEKVTSVSGRGVGMDVVRNNIEKIGGTVELKSQPGKGSSFIIKIPLTLAIVSALIVECGGERFAIPQISVQELVRVTPNSEHGIEMINNAPVLRLRDRLLPLVSLKKLLKLSAVEDDDETFIVVAQVGTYTFGIIVDRVFDTEEIVVKPVAPILRHITMFSGNTILGDGSVIMILDPNGIAGATGEQGMLGGGQAVDSHHVRDHGETKTSMLVFRAGGEDLRAVPLALVARLEEIELDKIEHSNGKPMVQYRGHLMPLISVDGICNFQTEGRQPVLVFSDQEHTMGLVVDEIVDIVEDVLKVELSNNTPGVMGTAVIAGRATTVIDAGYYLPQAFGDWFGRNDDEFDAGDGSSGSRAARVLLVDDSPFFRNLLKPMLSVAGYQVEAVEGPDRALVLRDQGYDFDLIISDIEMPGMNGFEFASAVRKDGRWQDVPMIALSSHATERDFERGRVAGFNDYVAKFDRDMLLQTIANTVSSTIATGDVA